MSPITPTRTRRSRRARSRTWTFSSPATSRAKRVSHACWKPSSRGTSSTRSCHSIRSSMLIKSVATRCPPSSLISLWTLRSSSSTQSCNHRSHSLPSQLNRFRMTIPWPRVKNRSWGYQHQKRWTMWLAKIEKRRGELRRIECKIEIEIKKEIESSKNHLALLDFCNFSVSRKMTKLSKDSPQFVDVIRRNWGKCRVPQRLNLWSRTPWKRRKSKISLNTWRNCPSISYRHAQKTNRRSLIFTSRSISKWSQSTNRRTSPQLRKMPVNRHRRKKLRRLVKIRIQLK